MIFEAYYFMIFFCVFVAFVGVTKIDVEALQLVEGAPESVVLIVNCINCTRGLPQCPHGCGVQASTERYSSSH